MPRRAVDALSYSRGDRMQNVLDAPQRRYEPLFPVRRVLSDRLPARFPLAPTALLFDSIDEAAPAHGRALAGVTLP